MANDEGAGDLVVACGVVAGVAAWDDDAAGGDAAFVVDGLGAGDVDDLGGTGDDGVGAEDGFVFDVSAFDDDAAGADEAVVFDDDGCCLKGFEYASDANATAEVDAFAYLGAAADGGPGVDHGAFVDVGADVDVGGHHDDVFGEVGAVAGDGLGDDADALGGVVVLEGHFVVPFEGTGFEGLHLADGEVEEDGFFDPLVDLPAVGGGLGDADETLVELVDGLAYGLLHCAVFQHFAIVKGFFDEFYICHFQTFLRFLTTFLSILRFTKVLK